MESQNVEVADAKGSLPKINHVCIECHPFIYDTFQYHFTILPITDPTAHSDAKITQLLLFLLLGRSSNIPLLFFNLYRHDIFPQFFACVIITIITISTQNIL